MKKKSRIGLYIWLAIASIFILTNTSTILLGPKLVQEKQKSFNELALEANLTRYCIEYNKEDVLRYEVTCEHCSFSFNIEDSGCNNHTTISENKYCDYGLFIKAKPVETTIDTDCKVWGFTKKQELEIKWFR